MKLQAIRIALKNKKNLSELEPKYFIIKDRIIQGKSVGAVFFVLYETSKQLGIEKSLWSSRQGKLALWQILARIIGLSRHFNLFRKLINLLKIYLMLWK